MQRARDLSGAAVDDIFDDVRTSFNNSVARGGTIKERAEQQLTPVITMIDAVEEELKLAKSTTTPDPTTPGDGSGKPA